MLERLPGEWDPDWVKSSCYRIDFHGQRWFELMGILDDLAAAAVLYDYMVNIMDTKVRGWRILPSMSRSVTPP